VRDAIIATSLPRNERTQRPPTDPRCAVRVERHHPPLTPQLRRRERRDRAPERVSRDEDPIVWVRGCYLRQQGHDAVAGGEPRGPEAAVGGTRAAEGRRDQGDVEVREPALGRRAAAEGEDDEVVGWVEG
jgi:hypothetical protein